MKAKLAIACLLVGLGLAVLGWMRWSQPGESFPDNPLPPLQDVAAIQAITVSEKGTPEHMNDEYPVPEKLWGELYATLQPARFDAMPASWVWLGELKIKEKNGSSWVVWLFSLSNHDVGACAVGRTADSRVYYRGGNSLKLDEVLKRARAESRM